MDTYGVFRAGACLAALLLLSATPSLAGRHLVSDPYPKSEKQPERFDFTCGNSKFSRPPETLRNGGKRLKLDLSTLPDGEIILKVKAVNELLGLESKTVSVRLLKKGNDVTLLSVVTELPASPAQETAPVIPKQKIPPSRTYPGHLRSN